MAYHITTIDSSKWLPESPWVPRAFSFPFGAAKVFFKSAGLVIDSGFTTMKLLTVFSAILL